MTTRVKPERTQQVWAVRTVDRSPICATIDGIKGARGIVIAGAHSAMRKKSFSTHPAATDEAVHRSHTIAGRASPYSASAWSWALQYAIHCNPLNNETSYMKQSSQKRRNSGSYCC